MAEALQEEVAATTEDSTSLLPVLKAVAVLGELTLRGLLEESRCRHEQARE